jgi:small ubiquitin-related modifier
MDSDNLNNADVMDNNAEEQQQQQNNPAALAPGGAAAGEAAGDSKPSGEQLSLKVKGQDGNEVYFKVKRTTQFSKIMNAYCKKIGAESDSVRFLFDGNRLRADQTPGDLEMEDEGNINI